MLPVMRRIHGNMFVFRQNSATVHQLRQEETLRLISLDNMWPPNDLIVREGECFQQIWCFYEFPFRTYKHEPDGRQTDSQTVRRTAPLRNTHPHRQKAVDWIQGLFYVVVFSFSVAAVDPLSMLCLLYLDTLFFYSIYLFGLSQPNSMFPIVSCVSQNRIFLAWTAGLGLPQSGGEIRSWSLQTALCKSECRRCWLSHSVVDENSSMA